MPKRLSGTSRAPDLSGSESAILQRGAFHASPIVPRRLGRPRRIDHVSASLAVDGGTPVRSKPLRATYYGPEYYDDKELSQLRDVIESRQPFRWYGPGSQPPRKALEFEKALAARMQVKYALGVTSGTAALTTALAALGVGPGDEVILPAWSWYSCFNSIVMNGALPVIAESDESFNLDPSDVESKITPQTRAIMVVHTLGNPADMDAHHGRRPRARRQGAGRLRQSLGGSYKGKPVGSIGDIGIYSFQIAKTISSGEGGGLVTNDPLLFERAARYHDLGLLRPPHQAMLGSAALPGMIGNQYRMSEFTAAVLLAQLRKLDTILAALRGHARRVYDGIAGLPGLQLRHRPDPDGDTGSTVWLGFASRDRARPVPHRHGCRERPGESPARGRPRAALADGRAEADRAPQLAVLHQ